MAKVNAISISDRKGVRKDNVESAKLVENFGIEGDAHGGGWHRQISLLAEESIDFMRDKGLDVVAGNFAENITTEGIDLLSLPIGTHITIGETELVISQIGKICHNRCAIYHQAGDCVMPREGIFAIVLKGGTIKVDDTITVLKTKSASAAIITNKEASQDLDKKALKTLNKKLGAAFTRIDTLKTDGSNLVPILTDLTNTQKIDHVYVYDKGGIHEDAFLSNWLNFKSVKYFIKLKDIIESIEK